MHTSSAAIGSRDSIWHKQKRSKTGSLWNTYSKKKWTNLKNLKTPFRVL